MDSATASKLNQKIKMFPEDLLQEVDKFVDYLKFKSENSDWSETLNDDQKLLIEKGSEDISKGRTYTHTEAKQRIKDHIKSKSS